MERSGRYEGVNYVDVCTEEVHLGKRLSKELKSGDRLGVFEEEDQHGRSRVSEGEE